MYHFKMLVVVYVSTHINSSGPASLLIVRPIHTH